MMIKTLAASLIAAVAIGSVAVTSAAPAGGLHRGGGAGTGRGFKASCGAVHGVRRTSAFGGFPWYGVGSCETPPADVSVTDHEFVVPPTEYRRVCRAQA